MVVKDVLGDLEDEDEDEEVLGSCDWRRNFSEYHFMKQESYFLGWGGLLVVIGE